MARELSKYGVEVKLNTENQSVDVSLFERVGEDREVRATRSFEVGMLPDDIRLKSDMYGLSKILQDRTSSESKNPDRLESMDAVFARLCEGHWEKERESTGPTVSAEVEGLAALKGVSVADIQRALRNYTPEQREQILGSEAVQEKAAEIKAAREESDEVDLADLI